MSELVAAVSRAGGRSTDLTAVFENGGAGLWVGGTDIHWNAAGQRAGAAQVSAELLQREEVSERLRPGAAGIPGGAPGGSR